MKVLHITCFDNGGAGTATLRLHKGLLKLNIESKVLVLAKRTDAREVYEFEKKNKHHLLILRILKKLGLPQTLEHKNDNKYKKFKGVFEYFSFAKTSFTNLTNHPLVQNADIINLHWVPNFIDYQSFFKNINKPIVWTQHDMNVFQGGFHYKEDDLRNKHLFHINNEQYQCKLSAISKLSAKAIHVVSPSKWMLNEASNSEILGKFKHYNISNGIDPSIFNLKDSLSLKKQLGLDPNKLTVLFVSETVGSIRKGFNYIQELVNDFELKSTCEFVAVGNFKNSKKNNGVIYLGSINSEDRISQIYSSADIYLLPSREDNLPNVMLESLAAGTPIVAFNIGGIKDLVINGFNGFLSDELSAKGLKESLSKCISNINKFNNKEISQNLISKYNIEAQAKSYIKLYIEVISTD